MRKIRSKKDIEFNYWPSFVDVMSSIALVCIFMMIIFTTLIYGKYSNLKNTYGKFDDIGKNRALLYEKIESELKPQLGEYITFDKNNGVIEINTEILFDVDSYELTDKGKDLSRLLGNVLIEFLSNDKYKDKIDSIEVIGHTDNTYTGEYNRFLSTDRACAFVNEMLSSQDENKYGKYFKASGMSKFLPKAGTVENQTTEEEDLNRRIEVAINFNDSDIEESIRTFFSKNNKY
ncbi:OmpA family protein [Clostridium bornimense]|uniref:OmpA/MotB family protein n=1 Tax=Clostridium bornimense TaxID=1216932 RepID=UPI001C106B08|nr:OmpA family protein [Clostridium bornimense]MBU5315024.1 OmpA family protein [Clostridium bornimense]